MKEHGPKYGWKNLVYSGHDGHFDFTGGGEKIVPGDGKEKSAAPETKPSGSASSSESFNIESLLGTGSTTASPELGNLFNMEGITAFGSAFMGGMGDLLKEAFSGGDSKNLEPTAASRQTGSDLVEQSDNAEEASGSETVVVDLGGDQGPKGEVIMDGSLNTVPPELPDGPTSAAAADYYFTVNMCV